MLGQLHDVHRQAELEAAPADRGPELRCRLLRRPVGDDLDAEQQPATADVADALVALLQLLQPGPQPRTRRDRPFLQPLAHHDFEHLAGRRPRAAGR